jgi:hypothetical protein
MTFFGVPPSLKGLSHFLFIRPFEAVRSYATAGELLPLTQID